MDAVRQLEMAVCGKPEINIETLKSMTAMSLGNHEKLRQWFWAVLEGFKNEERADFLAFACGRSRLPTRPTGTMLWVNLDTSKGDAHCPTSHTCTLTIDLPAYSSKEVLQERLLYAIHNCREIDTDFAARDFGTRYDPHAAFFCSVCIPLIQPSCARVRVTRLASHSG